MLGRTLAVCALLASALGLGVLNSSLPPDHVAFGAYFEGNVNDRYILLNTIPRQSGAFAHEFHHLLQDIGMIDFDIPTAAALGYFIEWKQTGSLKDQAKERHLREGMNHLEPTVVVANILSRYAFDQDNEVKRSYKDGALLAGITLKTCGASSSEEYGMRYLQGLSIGLSHPQSAELCRRERLFKMASDLRNGDYIYLNIAKLPTNHLLLYRRAAFDIDGFSYLLKKHYRLSFIRKERYHSTTRFTKPSGALLHRRKLGLYLQTRPLALAIDFFVERRRWGKLSSKALTAAFQEGLQSRSPREDVQKILEKYRSSAADDKLLHDAAVLAGAMTRLFGRDLETTHRYVLIAALGLDHWSAERIARDPEVFVFLERLRDGQFMDINLKRLYRDLAPFDEVSQRAILRYVQQLKTEYRISFVQPASPHVSLLGFRGGPEPHRSP